MGKEIYIDFESKEGKVILDLAKEYLKETLYAEINNLNQYDILEIWWYNGDLFMELNVFKKGKYYLVSNIINNDWLKPKLREARLNDLGI